MSTTPTTPTTPAPPATYHLLLALHLGQRLAVAGGRLAITLPPRWEPVVVATLDDALHDAESRGWVEIPAGEAADPVLTERGRWWLDRWMKAKLGRRWKETMSAYWVAWREKAEAGAKKEVLG